MNTTTQNVKAKDLKAGDVINFTEKYTPAFLDSQDQNDYDKWERALGAFTVESVVAKTYRTMQNTGRSGREYVVTFDNGRAVSLSPSRQVAVIN